MRFLLGRQALKLCIRAMAPQTDHGTITAGQVYHGGVMLGIIDDKRSTVGGWQTLKLLQDSTYEICLSRSLNTVA
jgi:hypothetical protein